MHASNRQATARKEKKERHEFVAEGEAMVNAGQILRISEIVNEGRYLEDKAVRTLGKYVFSNARTMKVLWRSGAILILRLCSHNSQVPGWCQGESLSAYSQKVFSAEKKLPGFWCTFWCRKRSYNNGQFSVALS